MLMNPKRNIVLKLSFTENNFDRAIGTVLFGPSKLSVVLYPEECFVSVLTFAWLLLETEKSQLSLPCHTRLETSTWCRDLTLLQEHVLRVACSSSKGSQRQPECPVQCG